MSTRLYASIAIVLLLYLAYCWYMYDPSFALRTSTASAVESFQQAPIQAVQLLETAVQKPMEMDRNHERALPIQGKDEVPFDSQEATYESAQIPERLRHPERSYSPGYVNDETATAVASGVASYSAAATQKAEQTFGPEFVQNGGQFMEGISANDDSAAVKYSGF